MRKTVVFFVLFIAVQVIQPARAQLFYTGTEYGISAGASQYFGDLNDNYGFKFIRPAGGIFVRQHLNPYISLRGSVNYTFVGYDDKLSDNPYNQARNLSFRSDIFEAVVQAEFNFFRFVTGEENGRWSPYLTGGIGAFYYNPYTFYQGRKYFLRPLGTEGQQIAGYEDRKYTNYSMCFPVGAGVKYWIRPGVNLGFEVTDRLTTTDYLDDVSSTYVGANNFPSDPRNPNPAYYLQDRSTENTTNSALGRAGKQRGNTSTSDQYLMCTVTLSFQFKTYRCPGYIKRGLF